MSALGGSSNSAGGAGGKGVSSHSTTTTKTTKTKTAGVGADMVLLRAALRDQDGKDLNVLKPFERMAKYKRNGLDVKMELHFAKLDRRLFKWALLLNKQNVKQAYNECGYGWDEDEVRDELNERANRFIFLRNAADNDKLCGYISFGFSLSGQCVDEMSGEPALFVNEIQLTSEVTGKGLGKYIMMILELIAKKHAMSLMIVPLVKGQDRARNFFVNTCKGFAQDENFGEDDCQEILSKDLSVAAAKTLADGAAKAAAADKATATNDNATTSAPATGADASESESDAVVDVLTERVSEVLSTMD